MGMKHFPPDPSQILPAVLLVLTLAASIAILARVLNQPEARYGPVDFRNIDIGHLPTTRERKELTPRDEGLSSLDVIPKIPLPYSNREPVPEEPPPVTPSVKTRSTPPPAPPQQAPPRKQKRVLQVPAFKRIELKGRAKSSASSSAFLGATKSAAPSSRTGSSAAPSSGQRSGPRTYRNIRGDTVIH